jgi:predicted transcriptional regulator
MTAEEFKAWRTWMGFDKHEAAEALGVTYRMVDYYETDKRIVSRTVALLCEALAKGRRKRARA